MSQSPAPLIDFNGMQAVALATPDGSTAKVLLHGAQVVSWCPGGGPDRLYLSEKAEFVPGNPVRGGVPVCFPQFARRGTLRMHGFARNRLWQLVDAHQTREYAMAVLRLNDDEASRAEWPHAFQAELTVSLSAERLDVELEVLNPGDGSFEFTAALHTYLRVKELEESTLEGLRGLRYFDSRTDTEHRETGVALAVDDEINRIYFDLARPLLLREPQRALGIHAEHFPDVVVWNPWETGSPAIPDLPPGGFRRYLCVEAAAVQQPVTLQPEQSWWGRQTLVAM